MYWKINSSIGRQAGLQLAKYIVYLQKYIKSGGGRSRNEIGLRMRQICVQAPSTVGKPDHHEWNVVKTGETRLKKELGGGPPCVCLPSVKACRSQHNQMKPNHLLGQITTGKCSLPITRQSVIIPLSKNFPWVGCCCQQWPIPQHQFHPCRWRLQRWLSQSQGAKTKHVFFGGWGGAWKSWKQGLKIGILILVFQFSIACWSMNLD